MCATSLAPGCAATRQPPPPQLSKDAVVLAVPLTENDPGRDAMYLCGLASLSTLCEYYRAPIPEPERKKLAALAVERHGLSGAELRDALERQGFEVFLFEGTLDRADTGLFHHVDAGRPLIVMTSPGGETNHYVLFLGYDEPNGNVCLLDPVLGRVIEPSPTFERSWEKCKHFTLLALPEENPSKKEVRL